MTTRESCLHIITASFLSNADFGTSLLGKSSHFLEPNTLHKELRKTKLNKEIVFTYFISVENDPKEKDSNFELSQRNIALIP